jgi:hypothetical protein
MMSRRRAPMRTLAAIVAVALLVPLSVDLPSFLVSVPWAVVGALLVIRRRGDAIGPLLIAFAWTFPLTSDPVITGSALKAGGYDWTIGARLVASRAVGFASYAVLFLLTVTFPDGRLPTGRWRIPVVLLAGSTLAIAVLGMFLPVMTVGQAPKPVVEVPNPIGSRVVGDVFGELYRNGWPFLILLAAIVAGIVSLVVRRSRATGMRRRQFDWMAAALGAVAAAVLFAFVVLAVAGIAGVEPPEWAWIPALFSFPLPPLAIGVAVLRYRLYEIDRLVSRTIGYGIATAGLLASFAALTLALQTVLDPIIQGRALAVAASTLVVFSLFQPIHRWIQRIVDRRFDRARYDADRAATAFARGVRDETDLGELEDALVRTVDGTLAPATRTVWVRDRLHRATS